MIRLTLAIVATAFAIAVVSPAQAIVPRMPQNGVSLNGLELNGLELNGRNMQGRSMQGRVLQGRNMQGVAYNGVESHEITGGTTLLAIELAQ